MCWCLTKHSPSPTGIVVELRLDALVFDEAVTSFCIGCLQLFDECFALPELQIVGCVGFYTFWCLTKLSPSSAGLVVELASGCLVA